MPHVLLVDDDATQLKLSRLRLVDAGFEVTTATGGREALELARRQTPDAIVSDVLMDELDGFGFCRLVRDEPSLDGVPIILLSAHYRGKPDQDLALRVGASALLGRTADFDVELEALRASLAKTSQLTRLLDKARSAEERYRTLLERLPDVIWTATTDRRLTFVTPNVEEVLGYTAEEMCAGAGRQGDVHPDDRPALARAAAALLKGEGTFDMEYRRRRKDGAWIWLRTRVFASYERDGVSYIDGITTDVTERRRLEEGLFHVAKLDAVGQATAGIAHDFNNILAIIMANTHFLNETFSDGDPRRDDVEEIRRATERAVTLTRQLLAFGRKQVLAPTSTHLDAVIRDLGKMLRRVISEDIDIVVRPTPDLGIVRVDVGQLEQVIMNLAVNARDAMPSGGTLTFATANVELDGHGDQPSGRYARLDVTDTGCGMTAEVQQRIFEPFFTTKEVGKGTGLGLASCYGIVKQSGGHIEVRSAPGCGSTFSIFLPRIDGPVERPRTMTSPTAALRGSETVLLVEDDPRVRQAVARMLRTRGYTVLEAGDGDEAMAIARARARDIDLVVSDVVMPGASGAEVVRQVRDGNRGVRALFMSGYNEHPALQAAVSADGLHILQKPFTPEALARKVREVLDSLPRP